MRDNLSLHRAQRTASLEEIERDCINLMLDAPVLAYMPEKCAFAVVHPEGFSYHRQGGCLYAPYEIRAFNKTFEIRWLAIPEKYDPDDPGKSQGVAVLLWDGDEASLPPKEWTKMKSVPVVDTRIDRYILWGVARETSKGGWTPFFEHRTGCLYVPIEGITSGERAAVSFIEYLAEDDAFGNIAVKAERLLGLEQVELRP